MEEGTFTLVDQTKFYRNDDESDESENAENGENARTRRNLHRKVVRRKPLGKPDGKISKRRRKKRKPSKVDHKFTTVTIKTEPAHTIHNGFEFCATVPDAIQIKEEPPTDDDKKDNSGDSDDDIPLAVLDKTRKLQVKKENGTNLELNHSEPKKRKTDHNQEYCTKCKKNFESRKKFRSHMRKKHGKLYKCKLCMLSFNDKADLEDHYNYHTGNRPYSCYLCDDATFKTKSALKTHMNRHHSGRPLSSKKGYTCHECGKVLFSRNSLEEHIRIHTGEKPIVCKECNKTFTRENDLRQHQNIHDELWKCKFCNKCFTTPFKLKEHIRIHTGELPYECDKCDRKFARSADFRYHVGTHLGIKPYNCEECGMRFTTSSSVTRHRLNMHQTGPKIFQCPICPKKFHTRSRLNTHVKNHENTKRYKCDLCPATRTTMSDLNKHLITHGGDFRCDTCHKGFQSAERLRAHTTKHDIAGKPYACFICSLGYRSSQSLNKHLATVHKNEDIPKIAPQHLCTLCGQVFEAKDKLNRHLKDNHIVIVVGEVLELENEDNQKTGIIDEKETIVKELVNPPEALSLTEKEENGNDKDVLQENSTREETPTEVLNNVNEEKILEPPAKSSDEDEDEEQSLEDETENVNRESVNENVETSKDTNVEPAVNTNVESSVPNETITDIPSAADVENDSESSIEDIEEPPVNNIEKSRSTVDILNIPNVPHPVEVVNNTEHSNISSISNMALPLKNNIDLSMKVPEKTYESNSIPSNYSNAVISQPHTTSLSNYRPTYENYSQVQTPEQINNSWLLSKSSDIMSAHRQQMQRTFFDTGQRYDLRMPINHLQINQANDYRNFNNGIERLPFNQRFDVAPQIHRSRDHIIDNRKYYYDIDQRMMSEDRRKFTQHMATDMSTDLSRQAVREYSNHILPSRDYMQSSLVCDLSNTGNPAPTPQPTHYTHHNFPSHHFFQNYRDLQHRMLGVQNYQHSRNLSQMTGMDMTNQRMNPASPISPYHTGSHVMDNLSPMSRSSYEDLSNAHVSSLHGYHAVQGQGRDGVSINTRDTNPKNDNGGNNEQISNGGSYEMRVIAN